VTHGAHTFPSPSDALDALLALFGPVDRPPERVPLGQSHGRVLAETISTDRDSPACDVSAMDGYAVRLADARVAGSLPIVDDARIGLQPPTLAPGGAMRIVTGAPLPPGADAVVKREDVAEHLDHIVIEPTALATLKVGTAIRRRAENAAAGQPVLQPGVPIAPAQVASLASVGAASPLVRSRVRVAILVTGDELVPVDQHPTQWQLRDSNGPALAALFAPLAWTAVDTHRHAADELEETTGAIRSLADAADVLFITGGVSMGNRDHVPAALAALGARTVFHKLPQRPGKPVLAAILPDGTPVLALPGNPVSVMVTARRLGVPVVRRRAGFEQPLDLPRAVTLTNPDDRAIDLWWHRPALLATGSTATLIPNMGSGDIMATGMSDGFVELPPRASGPGPWGFYPWTP
jgi:molybdopterin molybdotransferase